MANRVDAGGVVIKMDIEDKTFQSKVGKAKSTMQGFGNDVGKMLSGIATKFIAIFAVGQIINFGKQVLKTFREGKDTIDRFNQTVKNMGVYTKENVKELEKQQLELQKLTNYGDEVTRSAQTSFMRLGMTIDNVKKATESYVDLLASGKSGQALEMYLRNPLQYISRLTREYQVNLDETVMKTMTVAQQQSYVLDQIQKKYGGLASAMADPFKQINNWIGDTQELLGEILFDNIKEGAIGFRDVLIDVYNLIDGNKEEIKSGLGFFTGQIKEITGSLFGLFKTLGQNKDVQSIFGNLFDIAKTAFSFVSGLIKRITDGIGEMAKKNPDMIKTIADIVKYVKEILSLITSITTNTIELRGKLNFGKKIWEDLKKYAKPITEFFTGIFDFIKSIYEKVDELLLKANSDSIIVKQSGKDAPKTRGDQEKLRSEILKETNKKTLEDAIKIDERQVVALKKAIEKQESIIENFKERVKGTKFDTVEYITKNTTNEVANIEKLKKEIERINPFLDLKKKRIDALNPTKKEEEDALKIVDIVKDIEKQGNDSKKAVMKMLELKKELERQNDKELNQYDEITQKVIDLKNALEDKYNEDKDSGAFTNEQLDREKKNIEGLIDKYEELLLKKEQEKKIDENIKKRQQVVAFGESNKISAINENIQSLSGSSFLDFMLKSKEIDEKLIEEKRNLTEKIKNNANAVENEKKAIEYETYLVENKSFLSIEEKKVIEKKISQLRLNSISMEDGRRLQSELNKTTKEYQDALKQRKEQIRNEVVNRLNEGMSAVSSGVSASYSRQQQDLQSQINELQNKRNNTSDLNTQKRYDEEIKKLSQSLNDLSKESEQASEGMRIASESMQNFTKAGGGLIGLINMLVGWLMNIITYAIKFSDTFGKQFAIIGQFFEAMGKIVGVITDLTAIINPFVWIVEFLSFAFEGVTFAVELMKPLIDQLLIPLRAFRDFLKNLIPSIEPQKSDEQKVADQKAEWQKEADRKIQEQIDIAKKQLEEQKKQTEYRKFQIEQLDQQIEALNKAIAYSKKSTQIQESLLQLELDKVKSQYNLDTAGMLYKNIIDKVFNPNNPLYKVGSVNESEYKSIIRPDGTIDTVLANKLLTNLKFDELDKQDFFGDFGSQLENIISNLVSEQNNFNGLNDREIELKEEWETLQKDVNTLLKQNGTLIESSSSAMYKLLENIQNTDFGTVRDKILEGLKISTLPQTIQDEIVKQLTMAGFDQAAIKKIIDQMTVDTLPTDIKEKILALIPDSLGGKVSNSPPPAPPPPGSISEPLLPVNTTTTAIQEVAKVVETLTRTVATLSTTLSKDSEIEKLKANFNNWLSSNEAIQYYKNNNTRGVNNDYVSRMFLTDVKGFQASEKTVQDVMNAYLKSNSKDSSYAFSWNLAQDNPTLYQERQQKAKDSYFQALDERFKDEATDLAFRNGGYNFKTGWGKRWNNDSLHTAWYEQDYYGSDRNKYIDYLKNNANFRNYIKNKFNAERIASGLPTFHTGGIVGGQKDYYKMFQDLKYNEVPAILQRGEAVISKTDWDNIMSKLKSNVNSQSSNVFQINIEKVDGSDPYDFFRKLQAELNFRGQEIKVINKNEV